MSLRVKVVFRPVHRWKIFWFTFRNFEFFSLNIVKFENVSMNSAFAINSERDSEKEMLS